MHFLSLTVAVAALTAAAAATAAAPPAVLYVSASPAAFNARPMERDGSQARPFLSLEDALAVARSRQSGAHAPWTGSRGNGDKARPHPFFLSFPFLSRVRPHIRPPAADTVIRLGSASPHYVSKEVLVDAAYAGHLTIRGGWCEAPPCHGMYTLVTRRG